MVSQQLLTLPPLLPPNLSVTAVSDWLRQQGGDPGCGGGDRGAEGATQEVGDTGEEEG